MSSVMDTPDGGCMRTNLEKSEQNSPKKSILYVSYESSVACIMRQKRVNNLDADEGFELLSFILESRTLIYAKKIRRLACLQEPG